jgi:hypothetical protein
MKLLLESGFAHHGMGHTVFKSCGLSGAYEESGTRSFTTPKLEGIQAVDPQGKAPGMKPHS